MPLAGRPAGVENRGWLPADVVPAWCLAEAVKESDAGSCLRGPALSLRAREPASFPVPPAPAGSLVPVG
jgi:hypothetical protein